MKSNKFNENLANKKITTFFGVEVLGPPVWKPGPKILGGPAGAPQNGPSGALPATILGAPVEML
jgi:hypothetical protein